MAKIKDLMFWESAYMNNRTYQQYYMRMTELAVSMFDWKGLPKSVNAEYMEKALFAYGQAVFFKDDVLGFLALPMMSTGMRDIYNIPIQRQGYADNGYRVDLTIENSVAMYNNSLHSSSKVDVEMFAKRLYNLDRIIDVNANAQKTPVIVECDENDRLTMVNLYKKYEGNEPFIFGKKGLNKEGLKVLSTGAPYICDKLTDLKNTIWNEYLTYLGISNISIDKKERLVSDEVTRNMGGVIASRFSRLGARQKAAKEINAMFGLNISVDFKEEYKTHGEGGEPGDNAGDNKGADDNGNI